MISKHTTSFWHNWWILQRLVRTEDGGETLDLGSQAAAFVQNGCEMRLPILISFSATTSEERKKEEGGDIISCLGLGAGRRFSYSSLSFWSVGSRSPFWHHLLRLPGAANPRSQWPHLAPDRDGHDDHNERSFRIHPFCVSRNSVADWSLCLIAKSFCKNAKKPIDFGKRNPTCIDVSVQK